MVLYWYCRSAPPTLCGNCTGTALVLCLYRADAALILYWHSAGAALVRFWPQGHTGATPTTYKHTRSTRQVYHQCNASAVPVQGQYSVSTVPRWVKIRPRGARFGAKFRTTPTRDFAPRPGDPPDRPPLDPGQNPRRTNGFSSRSEPWAPLLGPNSA